MDNFWLNFALEIGLFGLLGVMYYFYQKRKLIQYEKNKAPIVMGFILQACLSERGEEPGQLLDQVIEALDDFVQGKSSTPPTALLTTYSRSPECSEELKHVILEGLRELES